MENKISRYCVAKHIKSFHEQSRSNKTADFGEPCFDCKYMNNCKGDWLPKIKTVMTDEVELRLVN